MTARIEATITATVDGYLVDLPHGAVTLRYGPYAVEQDARFVAARLGAQLVRERPQQGALFPESA